MRLCSILFRLFVFMSYWTEADTVAQRCSAKKMFLEISQNSQACNFIKIESLAQVFFSEFWEISKNTFSYRTPPVATSAEMYSEPCQKLQMELFAKIVNDWKSLPIFTKASSEMLDRTLNTPSGEYKVNYLLMFTIC